MPHTVAFFGLGEIGAPVAAHLATAGYEMLVANRSPAKVDAWLVDNPGTDVSADRAAVAQADVVISCVGDDADLQELYLGPEGIGQHVRAGALVIDHTTASAAMAHDLGEALDRRGARFMDAPVSGGSAGAQNGALAAMVGGDPATVDAAEPVMRHYTRAVNHVGDIGSGQLCKMVNQLCIAGTLQGLAEAIALTKATGLDPDRVLAAISRGAAASWQMDNRSSFMLDDQYVAGFAARLMHKDLSLCLNEADRLGIRFPVASLVAEQYADLIAGGFGDEDFSNLHRLLLAHAH